MTRIMLIVTAALLAGTLACGKEPAAAPAKSTSGAAGATGASGAVAAAPAAAPAAASTAGKAINANCPIGGEPITADGGTASFKGQTIGFCCSKCAPKFNEMDDAGKIAALEKNGTKLPQ